MTISLIVAISANGVIGRQGDLPWRLSADLRRFKQLTMGHHLVMGRKTFESIGRLLPGRTTVIVTRNPGYRVDGAVIANSLDDALRACEGDDQVFIVGGAQIYEAALPRVDRLYVTRVHAEVMGDTRFPDPDLTGWRLVTEERGAADEKNDHPHSFCMYERDP